MDIYKRKKSGFYSNEDGIFVFTSIYNHPLLDQSIPLEDYSITF